MGDKKSIRRRSFLHTSLAASAGVTAVNGVRADSNGAPDQEDFPCGKIGNVKVSRLILGSNLLIGGAHPRDLAYVRKLMGRYNTKERILNVLKLAESEGINTVLMSSANPALIRKYNTEYGGHMQQIRRLDVWEDDTDETIKRKLDQLIREEIPLIYLFGCSGDLLVRDGRIDMIDKALNLARDAGMVCGIGGHSLSVVTACEKQGLRPAFYVKTFHHDQYWSATPRENRKDMCWYGPGGNSTRSGVQPDHNEFHDNIWCLEPEETAEVMKKVTVPWIAFKVLAAGAISPTDGFKYVLQNGADFMAVGMLDFQIEEDAAIVKGLFARGIKRDRPWMG